MSDFALYTYFNDNYFECGSNMIFSFTETNKWFVDKQNPIIVLQDDKFCELSKENKTSLLKIYPSIQFQQVNMDTYEKIFNMYNWCKDNNNWVYNENGGGINRGDDAVSAFYKYEIFKKNDIKHKVLLDADIIVRSSIQPLFETNSHFTCCPHGHTTQITKRTEKEYFNGGVYAINEDIEDGVTFTDIINFSNKLTKQELLSNDCAKYNGVAVEQDYLNIFFDGKNVDLYPSSVYNCCVSDDLSKAAIIHYYGPYNKPWQLIGQKIARNKLGFLLYYEVNYWKNKRLFVG